MSWRYGLTVMRLSNGEDRYEIRELFESNGKWNSWTENAIPASGETRQEAIEALEMMLKDAKQYKAKRIPYQPKNPKEGV